MSSSFKGIAASSGYAFGKANILVEPNLSFEEKKITNVTAEIDRIHQALHKAKEELLQIRAIVVKKQGEENAAIFDAHVMVLDDPELISSIETKIETDKVNAEYALKETTDMFVSMFEQMDNEYMRERAADIKDVSTRVLSHLLGVTLPNPGLINEQSIIVAVDLTPSDTAQINKEVVHGFVTNIGGRTSHSAIMARSMEIPAIVGTKTATSTVNNGDFIIVDGINGDIIINPSDATLEEYQDR